MLDSRSDFHDAITHTRRRIESAQIQGFAVPHIVVDDVLSSEMVERINVEWPGQGPFNREVPGNFIYQMYQRDYGKMSELERKFWIPFNEQFWPALIASCAQVFSPLLRGVFDELPQHHFGLDWPLTLAQGTAEYRGINVHNHFWHCPHWAFTVLLYIDPEDKGSSGTALHRVGPQSGESNYSLDCLDENVAISMDQTRWEEMGKLTPTRIISYRPNRLFVMLDGPMAIHSVRAGPEAHHDASVHARRRVLRCHAKVHHHPFYESHAQRLGVPFGPVDYMRIMDWGAKLNDADIDFRKTVMFRFYRERIAAYARTWAAYTAGTVVEQEVFLRQARERIP
jgi:hypothetical protein